MGGTRKPLLDGSRYPVGRGNFEGRRNGHPIVKYRDTLRSSKTAEPSEVPFAMRAQTGPRNHVLDGSPQVLRDGRCHGNQFWD